MKTIDYIDAVADWYQLAKDAQDQPIRVTSAETDDVPDVVVVSLTLYEAMEAAAKRINDVDKAEE